MLYEVITLFVYADSGCDDTGIIRYCPARIVLPRSSFALRIAAIVDLAAMRDAMQALGGDPDRINPLQPAELVT